MESISSTPEADQVELRTLPDGVEVRPGSRYDPGASVGQVAASLRGDIKRAVADGSLVLPSGARTRVVSSRHEGVHAVTITVGRLRPVDLPPHPATIPPDTSRMSALLVELLQQRNQVVVSVLSDGSEQHARASFRGDVLLVDEQATTRQEAIRQARKAHRVAVRTATESDREAAYARFLAADEQVRQAFAMPLGVLRRG